MTWQNITANNLKTNNMATINPSSPIRDISGKFSTLRGFIIATISAQLKSQISIE